MPLRPFVLSRSPAALPALLAPWCVLALVACAPPVIRVPPAETVARVERPAREVEACVLVQESRVRPLGQGVLGEAGGEWPYVVASVLVRHPSGLLVVDPAFGRSIGEDLHRAGPVVTAIMGTGEGKTPLVEALAAAGIDPAEVRYATLTHAHWDHTGALGDLPQAQVLVAQAELEWLRPFTRFVDHGTMPHHFRRAKARLRSFDFSGPPVDGFPASFDLFGDGAVVAVPMPGHTPGSTGFLVRGRGGTTYLLAGDTAWTRQGVERPAHKSLRATDSDLTALSAQLGHLHALWAHRPDVKVLPAHDGAALAALPPCGPMTR